MEIRPVVSQINALICNGVLAVASLIRLFVRPESEFAEVLLGKIRLPRRYGYKGLVPVYSLNHKPPFPCLPAC